MIEYVDELVAKAAWYYYIEGMTQQSISEKLGISRMKVIKLLENAKENGVIQFRIAKSSGGLMSCEKALRDKYNLKDAYVIPSPSTDKPLNEILAQAAASYVASRITEQTFINMGYGDTPSRVLNHLATIADIPISIVSMTGGVNYYLPNIQSNVFKAKLYLYPTPLLLSSKEVCDAIKQEPSVSEITRMTKLSSMSIVGMGSMSEEATIISNGILTKNYFTSLSMQGAVGDILTHFIDSDGNPIPTELEDRLISTPLSELKKMENVIGIAGGLHKVNIIKATLCGGYIDELITDEDTANALLL